jgi:hypothetical protein
MADRVKLAAIELDSTIQCRADIDIATVNEYVEAMRAGDDFPPIDVFGHEEKCWVGDGWHRVMAATTAGLTEISATLHPGGRLDALRFALGANASHGRRRTNADKRCAVTIALRELGDMSDRSIAEMCAVDHHTVAATRREMNPIGEIPQCSTRTTSDGRRYPAHRKTSAQLATMEGKVRLPAAERARQIQDLAETGHTSHQISTKLGLSREHVCRLAAQHEITLPDSATHRVPGLTVDWARFIGTTVDDVEGLASDLSMLPPGAIASIEPDQAKAWAASLRTNLRTLAILARQLEGVTQ